MTVVISVISDLTSYILAINSDLEHRTTRLEYESIFLRKKIHFILIASPYKKLIK